MISSNSGIRGKLYTLTLSAGIIMYAASAALAVPTPEADTTVTINGTTWYVYTNGGPAASPARRATTFSSAAAIRGRKSAAVYSAPQARPAALPTAPCQRITAQLMAKFTEGTSTMSAT